MDESRLAELGDFERSTLFTEREKVALRYTEAELVEMGYLVGVFAGGQRWIHTLQVEHGEVAAESTTGYRAELVRTEKGAP